MLDAWWPLLVRPELYARTPAPFWDDPHIATHMLAAHLDPATDAASRQPEFIARCAQWVASLLAPEACVLDLGCGPGLYATQFARLGLRVTGIDLSSSSIAYARQHDTASTYVNGDYLTADLPGGFDAVTLIYYDYGALIPAERRYLLTQVRRALKPGGLFIFDVLTPTWAASHKDSTAWEANPHGGWWSPLPHVYLKATYEYENTAELRRTVVIEHDQIRCFNIWDCFFTEQTLTNELSPHGFASPKYYGDVAGTPLDENSPSIASVCRAAA